MLGLSGGAGGTGFGSPESAQIDKPATVAQANEQYKNAQDAMLQQQQFLQAVQAQNGLGNQTQVFNQLQGVTNGTGPNPAQAQLANATGANVANQTAMMAGQRGSNANVGLIARQAAMQGANTQQQAAGQSAAMQAQQSLNALNSMGSMANTQAAQQAQATQANTSAAQGEQSNILNSINGQNTAGVNMQGNINSANTSMANTRMGQQGQLMGNIMGGVGSVLGLAEGGVIPGSGEYAPIDPNAPDVFDPKNQPMQPMAIQPAAVAPITTPAASMPSKGPKSSIGKFLHSFAPSTDGSKAPTGMNQAGDVLGKAIGTGLKGIFGSAKPKDDDYSQSGFTPEQMDESRSRRDAYQAGGLPLEDVPTQPQATNYQADFAAAYGGRVPALVSPGEQYLPPKDVKKVVKEGKDPLSVGERIPGKPQFPGNDYRNDTVKKELKSGGLVIPNEVMQSANPHISAMKFVHAHIAKHRKSKKK